MKKSSEFQKGFYSATTWLRPLGLESGAHFLEAKKYLDNLSQGLFLDVGCATSPLGRYLANGNRGVRWLSFGLDFSQAIWVAQSMGVNACLCDLAECWPIEDNSFDVVFLGEVIEHFLDTDFVLQQTFRVLKHKGLVFVSTPNLTSLENRIRVLLGYHPRFMDFRIGPDSIGHCRYYTLNKLKSQLLANSFIVLHGYTINATLLTRTKEIKLPKLLNRFGLGTTLFVAARAIKE